ncbi:MAG: hypothetical protein KIH01_07645 [Candidatus Freyarchaeota archaeon]|nr:hypothetical protein [Candidatus Jordarchaeia archaeon]
MLGECSMNSPGVFDELRNNVIELSRASLNRKLGKLSVRGALEGHKVLLKDFEEEGGVDVPVKDWLRGFW